MKMFFLSSDSVRHINKINKNNTNTSSQKRASKPISKPNYRRRGMLPMFNINSIITTSYASSCNSCSG